jgi:hypothetical protein
MHLASPPSPAIHRNVLLACLQDSSLRVWHAAALNISIILIRRFVESGKPSPASGRDRTEVRELGHETIVAHARRVRLIGESRRKDDRLEP